MAIYENIKANFAKSGQKLSCKRPPYRNCCLVCFLIVCKCLLANISSGYGAPRGQKFMRRKHPDTFGADLISQYTEYPDICNYHVLISCTTFL